MDVANHSQYWQVEYKTLLNRIKKLNIIFLKSTLKGCKEQLIELDAGGQGTSELIEEMIEPSLRLLSKFKI